MRSDANRAGLISKIRGEATSSTTCSTMSESAGKPRKRYIKHPKDRLKLTFLIHGPGHSSDECKILREFGTNAAKCRPTKYHRQEEPANKKCFEIQKQNNSVFQHAVDEVILKENKNGV